MNNFSYSAAPPPVPDSNYPLLKVYALYRLFIAALLLGMFGLKILPSVLGAQNATLFLYTAVIYLCTGVITLARMQFSVQTPSLTRMFLIALIDIVAITALMHSSGGMESGLGGLLIITAMASAIFVPNRVATLIAAFAAIAVLASTYLRIIYQNTLLDTLLPAGILGALIFITSELFYQLSRRIRISGTQAAIQAEQTRLLMELNRLIVQRMRTGVMVMTHDGTLRLVNEAAARLLNIVEQYSAMPAGFSLRFFPDLYRQFMEWKRQPGLKPTPVKMPGALVEIQVNFASIANADNADVIVFVEDTRQLAQEAQRLKLASLGHLTASIAHEVRNPLGAISHAAQLLNESSTLDTMDQRLMDIILAQSQRVNQIITNVLDLSRRRTPSLAKVELGAWVSSFITQYCANKEPMPAIQFEDASEILSANIDTSQLEQVLTNLFDNGLRYSMQQTGIPSLHLHLYRDTTLETPCLDIIDQGAGIAENEVSNIFEPFYTTENTGTGLGLYIARELCEANAIRLDYRRTAAGESCFQLLFSHTGKIN